MHYYSDNHYLQYASTPLVVAWQRITSLAIPQSTTTIEVETTDGEISTTLWYFPKRICRGRVYTGQKVDPRVIILPKKSTVETGDGSPNS